MITDKCRNRFKAYEYAVSGYRCLDFSERAAEDMVAFESTGAPDLTYTVGGDLQNGYSVGKYVLSAMISQWEGEGKKDMLIGLLLKNKMSVPTLVREEMLSILGICELHTGFISWW